MQPAAPGGSTAKDLPPASSRKPTGKTVLAAAAGLVAGVILGVAGTLAAGSMAGSNAPAATAADTKATATAAPTGVLKNAVTSCGLPHDDDAKLGDNDTSLTLNGKGEKDFATLNGLPSSLMDCILGAAKTPDYVRSQMGDTRALDGTQHATWGTIGASWTYHPDDGLDVVLSEAPSGK